MDSPENKNTKNETPTDKVHLKRELGLISAIGVTITSVIGSGIFITPTSVLQETGSVGFCLIMWTLCGFIAHLGALVYSELGSVITISGGEYTYYQETFGKLRSGKSFLGQLPGFLYSFINVISRPAGMATLLLTSSEYIVELISIYHPEIDKKFYIQLLSILALLIITFINSISVKCFVSFLNLFSSLKLLACLIVVVGGIYYLSIGHTENLSTGFDGTKTDINNIALAFYSGLWAYEGWSSVLEISEEIKSPRINIPLSVSLGVTIVTVLYIMMNVAYMAVLTTPEMLKSQAVAVAFGEKLYSPLSTILTISVVFSTFSSAMTDQFGLTRLCYAAAKNGHVMEVFCYIHRKRSTPIPSLIFQCILTALYILFGNILQLMAFRSYIHWVARFFTMISFFILRKTMPDAPRPFRVPMIIPIIILLFSLFMVFTPLVTSPSPMFLLAIGMIGLAIIVYYPIIYKGLQPSCLGSFNNGVKKIFNVLPPEINKEQEST